MTEPPPDVVYTGIGIRAGGGKPAIAAALWTRGDRIAGIGPAGLLLPAAGPSARVHDLPGAIIVPGLIDAHCHPTLLGYLLAGVDCSQPGAPDIATICHRLAGAAPGADGWVSGFGFAEYKVTDRRMLTRADLDAAVPDRPAVVYQVSLHACVVNTAGLTALGLDDRSVDGPGGRLGRDAGGRLDGALYEQPVFDLLERNQGRHVATLGTVGRIAEMERAALHLASLGITACTDASVDRAGLDSLRMAGAAGRLPIRVTAMPWYESAGDLLRDRRTTGAVLDGVRLGGIKLFADGGMSSRTAALDAPYASAPDEAGVLLQEPAGLAARVRDCVEAGFQVGIHAQGDRGIRVALEALEPVCGGGNPLRHRIEHGGLFTAPLRRRAGSAGVHVVSQPGFLSVLGDGFLEAFGPERSGDLYPFAGLRDEGVVVAGSSDAPVITASPLVGMRDAVRRRTETGALLAPGQAITAAEALEMYTSRAAFVDHLDAELGSLGVGRLADLTILDRDPLAVDPAEIAGLKVLRTVVGGRDAYVRPA